MITYGMSSVPGNWLELTETESADIGCPFKQVKKWQKINKKNKNFFITDKFPLQDQGTINPIQSIVNTHLFSSFLLTCTGKTRREPPGVIKVISY